MKITNRYGTFLLDKEGHLIVLSDPLLLKQIEQHCGTAFVWEQLRQVQSELRQQRTRDTKGK